MNAFCCTFAAPRGRRVMKWPLALALLLPLALGQVFVHGAQNGKELVLTFLVKAPDGPVRVALEGAEVVGVKGAKLEGGEIIFPKLAKGEARFTVVARMKSEVVRVKVEHDGFEGTALFGKTRFPCSYVEMRYSCCLEVRAQACSKPFPLTIYFPYAYPSQKVLSYECAEERVKSFPVTYCAKTSCSLKAPVGRLKCVKEVETWKASVECGERCLLIEKKTKACTAWKAEEVCLWRTCSLWKNVTQTVRYCARERPVVSASTLKVAGKVAVAKVNDFLDARIYLVPEKRGEGSGKAPLAIAYVGDVPYVTIYGEVANEALPAALGLTLIAVLSILVVVALGVAR